MKISASVSFCPILIALACASSSKPVQSADTEPPIPKAELNDESSSDASKKPSSQPTPGSAAPAEPSAQPPPTPKAEVIPKDPAKTVIVTLNPKSGSKLTGKVTLTDKGEGVRVLIEVEKGKAGEHGAHIHEKADCSAGDASSAGDHFNPQGHEHGLPDKEQRHLGDLGNLSIGKDGKGTLEIVIAGANLRDGDPHSYIGRGLIVHEKKDDGGQPVGNAGGRVGCAEIK